MDIIPMNPFASIWKERFICYVLVVLIVLEVVLWFYFNATIHLHSLTCLTFFVKPAQAQIPNSAPIYGSFENEI